MDDRQEHHEQREIRLEKLRRLQSLGVNPYPYRFRPTHNAGELHEQGDALVEGGTEIAVAGRIMAMREMGKAAFAHLKDNRVRLQFYIRQDSVSTEEYEAFRLCDLGDYVGLHGTMMRTRTGELTVRVSRFELLAKAIRPLPVPKVEQKDGQEVVHDALRDVEFRYRQRYADLALNDDVAQVFANRTRIIQAVRGYLLDAGFLEVETPVLQAIYGGAAATPFVTHHKALDLPLYLRIATELYLKRLVVGGFDRVFEIGKDFRNEGIDRSHNPEFTMLEFYEAYADYTDMMERFEAIWERAALAVHGTTQFVYGEHTLDVKRPWRRLTMREALLELGGVDFAALDDGAVQALMKQHAIELEEGYNRGMAMAALFEALCEHKLIQPTFVIDFPKESTPLCKAHREHPDLVERFEPYIAGWEVGNAYSELNDPQVQQALFEEQVARRHGGHLEAHPYDADFIRAMEYGMPPMGGVGLGIDRMVMLLLNQPNIRDVLLFPTMRPEVQVD